MLKFVNVTIIFPVFVIVIERKLMLPEFTVPKFKLEGENVSDEVADGFTVSTKLCTAFDPIPLLAVNVTGNGPEVVGVPERTPVDVLKFTPPGSDPDSLSVGVGKPVAVTVKVPAVPCVNVVLALLVIAGA
jgi:hypothetical protein